ncbi:hypothetical protein EJ06DRAFT_255291 [Trichodelitschia bisporula]|uniref:Secreted protein n=1 Tax=Trichodelitschia bisporula TaxID=703511 RepID=A0A6G1HJ82_9PEZI|nr:hypothetical protein EJ06DRAFT_255291 [Trichodelitschia bisporula]
MVATCTWFTNCFWSTCRGALLSKFFAPLPSPIFELPAPQGWSLSRIAPTPWPVGFALAVCDSRQMLRKGREAFALLHGPHAGAPHFDLGRLRPCSLALSLRDFVGLRLRGATCALLLTLYPYWCPLLYVGKRGFVPPSGRACMSCSRVGAVAGKSES